ncbi:hypothetical protein [Brevundimonas sp.]|uniref:hypothetical protein n=1 Tax=Brevundimonas sp. TaxID=1871086 RepID=UPI00272EF243|nr:hypothetical protein [Brevundimonas sp.]MDP1911717.1 hypothetical protein [Brevundimonas sp.]
MTNTEGQLPGISWAELQTVLLSLADTPAKQMMVNHLVSGTRKQAAFLSPDSTFREILHIGAALLDSGFQPSESDMKSSAASCLSSPLPQ